MGRHSAPADDDEDAAAIATDAQDDTEVTGRHLRITDLPSAATRSIPVIDAELAADSDAQIAPVFDTPAREFEPILPGEAVVPPESPSGSRELDTLEALLGGGDEPGRDERPRAEPGRADQRRGAPDEAEEVPATDVPATDAPARPPARVAGAGPRPSPRPTKAEKDAARDEAREAKRAAREARSEAKAEAKAASKDGKPDAVSDGAVVDVAVVDVAVVEVEPVVTEQAESESESAEATATEPAEAEPVAVESSVTVQAETDTDTTDARVGAEPVADIAVADPPAATASPAPKTQHASAADLALLRRDRALLARVLAGLLAPFVIYVVVMLVVGGHGVQWLLWIWIPTITGCVLAGTFLDLAHKRAAASPS